MKILFWGTPEEAVPFLEVCAKEHDVLAVVTRPDRPSGRGLALRPCPVKQAAERLKIPVLQPADPAHILPEIEKLKPDLSVVVAYGKILKPSVLVSMRLGFINVHFSLLPKYRGAAPIAWALIRGETKTGVTLFWLDQGMDTGPVQARREIDVPLEEDAESLANRLVAAGVEVLRETLRDVTQGRIRREPQKGEPSLAPKLTREDAEIDFNRPALEFHNRVRGLKTGHRAYLQFKNGTVAILKTTLDSSEINSSPLAGDLAKGSATSRMVPAAHIGGREDEGEGKEIEELRPGSVVRVERNLGVLIQCNPGRIWIAEVQPEGKRQIPAADFINGLRLRPGDLFLSQ